MKNHLALVILNFSFYGFGICSCQATKSRWHHILMSNVMSRSFDRRCFDCFCGCFGDQAFVNFNKESILQRTLKRFGPVAVKIEIKEQLLSVYVSYFAGDFKLTT